ncbi:MAG: lactate utilization protein B [Bacteroidales bacterium]
MNKWYKEFLVDSDRVSNDLKHRKTIKFNMSKYDAAVEKGKTRYKNLEAAKVHIAERKRLALSELDKHLVRFEEKITSRGAKVLWAEDSAEAGNYINEIIKENAARLIVKSKSMTTEEIEFNHGVENIGVESVETDLGEYIVQIAGEKPYHIVTPAMHKSKLDVNKLFNEKFNLDINLSAEELTNFVRVKLRQLYQDAEIGVTGANFIISDIGGVAVTENEGNAIMSTAFPKVHIVIAGIEKIIPSMHDLGRFWPVLAAHGTGQAITVYNSIFTGPKTKSEEFGPEKLYVILLDNKRTELLKYKMQSDSLACIRCGACLNACPVYRNIGGYTYKATYGGPIGSVISPVYQGFDVSAHLSYACSICGKCTEVCPQKIDLHLLLLHNRNHDVDNYNSGVFRYVIKMFKFIALRPKLFGIGFYGFKNFGIKTFGKNIFSKKRQLPLMEKSFRNSFKPE